MFNLSRLRPAFLLAPAALAVIGLASCGGGGGDAAPEVGVVRIAVCGPMTGSAAAFGEMIKNAAKLMEKEVNEAGGIQVAGKMMNVEAVIFDDKGDTTEATNVARKVTSDDDLMLVIGHFNSTCSLAAKEEYNRVGIVEFSPGSTNVDVCRGGPFTFRNLYRDDFQGDQIAAYMQGTLGIKKAAVLYDNDDYGKGLMQSFQSKSKELGLEVVAPIPYLRERTQDFKQLVQQAKDAGVGAIFVAGLSNEAALIVKAARNDLQMDVPIIGGDGVMSPTFIKNAGKSAEGVMVTTPFLFNTGDDSPASTAFVESFNAMYGKDPDTWAALTYDAMGMALEAVRSAGLNRQAIRDKLAMAVDAASGYEGVTGTTYFDIEGDCYSKPVYMAVVVDGAFVPAEKQMK